MTVLVHSRGTFLDGGGSGKRNRKWMNDKEDEDNDGYEEQEKKKLQEKMRIEEKSDDELPVIYIITPTYSRGAQKADLTRLSHTLLLVPRIHWILVEDSTFKTELVTNFIHNLNQYIIPRMRGKMMFKSQSDTSFLSGSKSSSTSYFSSSLFDLKITHLNTETPADLKIKEREPDWLKPRGVNQRNLGLKWLRENVHSSHLHSSFSSTQNTEGKTKDQLNINLNNKELLQQDNNNNNFEGDSNQETGKNNGERFKHKMEENDLKGEGVVYFADDDNTYDLRLFEEIRSTKKVSIWPVALVGGLKVEKPLVKEGKVVGFNSIWSPRRPYPIDMAGFAINLNLLLSHPSASFSYDVPRGFQESHIISQLISGWPELEPKATNCTQVLVWHTRTVKPSFHREVKLDTPSDLNIEF